MKSPKTNSLSLLKSPDQVAHSGGGMRLIPLTQGEHTQIDCQDYESLSKYKWDLQRDKNGHKYAVRSGGILMHQQIMGFPDGEIDHHDRNGLNNQRYNLRLCSHSQNMMNQRKSLNPKSSHCRGVSKRKPSKSWASPKWRATIQIKGKSIHLGYFDNEIDAGIAYDNAAHKYFREFALLNFPIINTINCSLK